MKSKKKINEWLVLALLIALIVLSFLTIQPMLKIVISAALLSYLFYPLYKKIQGAIKNKAIASLLVIAIIIVVAIVLFGILANLLVKEMVNLYNDAILIFNEIKTTEPLDCTLTTCTLKERILYFFAERSELTKAINENLTQSINYLIGLIRNLLIGVPSLIVSTIFVLFITFFLFIDGEKIANFFENLLPLTKKNKVAVFKELSNTATSVIFGQIIVSIVQGLTGSLGLLIGALIFDIPNPGIIIWGIFMAISSFIPVIGTGLVWIPLGIINIIRGIGLNGTNFIWYGIFVIIWGAIAVANIDAFIRSRFVSQRTAMHPIVVLVSAFGGLQAFGFIGIFIGPIIISFLIKIIQIYIEEYNIKQN